MSMIEVNNFDIYKNVSVKKLTFITGKTFVSGRSLFLDKKISLPSVYK